MSEEKPGQIAVIKVPITLWFVLGFAVLGLSGLYWWASSSLEKTIVFFAAAATAAGTLAAASYASKALTESVKSRRENIALQRTHRALSFGERWNNPIMFDMRKVCATILKMKADGKSDDEIAEYADSQSVSVAHIMNFLEEVAIARECGAADPELLQNQFEGIVLTLWLTLFGWITSHRNKRQRPRVWIKVEQLYKEWST